MIPGDLARRARNLVAFYRDLPPGDHLAWLEGEVAVALEDVREEARQAGLAEAAGLCRQDAGTFDREDERAIGRWHAARLAALAEKRDA